jgi:hypothetical protein
MKDGIYANMWNQQQQSFVDSTEINQNTDTNEPSEV